MESGGLLTEGVEGVPVHRGRMFGLEEQRGDLLACEQVGVILRQGEPLQLVGKGCHCGFFCWSLKKKYIYI